MCVCVHFDGFEWDIVKGGRHGGAVVDGYCKGFQLKVFSPWDTLASYCAWALQSTSPSGPLACFHTSGWLFGRERSNTQRTVSWFPSHERTERAMTILAGSRLHAVQEHKALVSILMKEVLNSACEVWNIQQKM